MTSLDGTSNQIVFLTPGDVSLVLCWYYPTSLRESRHAAFVFVYKRHEVCGCRAGSFTATGRADRGGCWAANAYITITNGFVLYRSDVASEDFRAAAHLRKKISLPASESSRSDSPGKDLTKPPGSQMFEVQIPIQHQKGKGEYRQLPSKAG